MHKGWKEWSRVRKHNVCIKKRSKKRAKREEMEQLERRKEGRG